VSIIFWYNIFLVKWAAWLWFLCLWCMVWLKHQLTSLFATRVGSLSYTNQRLGKNWLAFLLSLFLLLSARLNHRHKINRLPMLWWVRNVSIIFWYNKYLIKWSAWLWFLCLWWMIWVKHQLTTLLIGRVGGLSYVNQRLGKNWLAFPLSSFILLSVWLNHRHKI